jgi:CHAT domain-containing protein/tetratricopeptide (TPR) repeat protein
MALGRVRCAVVLIGLVTLLAEIGPRALAQGGDDLAALRTQVSQLYGQGKYAEAIPITERYVGLARQKHGEESLEFATAISWLGNIFSGQGRTGEAEALYKRALTSFRDQAARYDHQDRFADAEPLYQSALAIAEKTFGPDHTYVGGYLDDLALMYHAHGSYAEAEPLFKRALAIAEKQPGRDLSDHLDGRTREELLTAGRYLHAVALNVIYLADLYHAQGRYTEAESLYQRALTIAEKPFFGPNHPLINSGTILNNLAVLSFVKRDWEHAADYWRRSITEFIRQEGNTNVFMWSSARGPKVFGPGRPREAGEPTTSLKGRSEDARTRVTHEQLINRFFGLVKAGYRSASLPHDLFQTVQWALVSKAGDSVAQMAVRAAARDPGHATVVRERQDLVAERQKLDDSRAAETPNREERFRYNAVIARINEIDKQLKAEFPEYDAISRRESLSVEQVQAKLRPDEALILFLDTPAWEPTPEEAFIWVVTKAGTRLFRSELGTKGLTEHTIALRCGLDRTSWHDATWWPGVTEEEKREKAAQLARRQRCAELLKNKPFVEIINVGGKLQAVNVLPFDLARAHELYKALLGPAEEMIKGKRLLIVPSGPLTALPLSVLVSKPSKTTIPGKLADYRDAAWLGAGTTMTVLPSVASLRSLRQFAKPSHATKPYLAIGNPLLEGPDSRFAPSAQDARDRQKCQHKPAEPTQTGSIDRGPVSPFQSLFRGGQADIEKVRMWAPLPETADELCDVARGLGADESEVLLGARATEAAIKELSEPKDPSTKGRLSDYAIVHFATHGALTGQVQGSVEPGLILTPAPKGTSDPEALDRDDGFLTASEIATLKLDADWVILSACNTAGASDETAEALSGMARAFFYAGARALLVSHWEVGSYAAVKLTTRAFAQLAADPKIGRAEAFRLSMKELIEKGSVAESHPSMWAPFVVVGEGTR